MTPFTFICDLLGSCRALVDRVHAVLQEDDKVNEQEKLTVQYRIKSRQALDHYFTEHSVKMREEGIKRFKDQFSATRRLFEIEEVILNK